MVLLAMFIIPELYMRPSQGRSVGDPHSDFRLVFSTPPVDLVGGLRSLGFERAPNKFPWHLRHCGATLVVLPLWLRCMVRAARDKAGRLALMSIAHKQGPLIRKTFAAREVLCRVRSHTEDFLEFDKDATGELTFKACAPHGRCRS